MSVYRQQATEMTDMDCLQEALGDMKLASGKKCEPVKHEEAQQLEGYHGDKREQKAHLVIPRQQAGTASNDIGFEKGADGKIVAHISEYDKHYYNTKWMADLKTKYVKLHGRKLARKNGLVFKGEQKLPNGKTRLSFVSA